MSEQSNTDLVERTISAYADMDLEDVILFLINSQSHLNSIICDYAAVLRKNYDSTSDFLEDLETYSAPVVKHLALAELSLEIMQKKLKISGSMIEMHKISLCKNLLKE